MNPWLVAFAAPLLFAVVKLWSVNSEMLAELRGLRNTLAKESEEAKGILQHIREDLYALRRRAMNR